MPEPLRVAYADEDLRRQCAMREALTAAGCAVITFPAGTHSYNAAAPELVLLSENLYARLHALAVALWPAATVLMLGHSDDHDTIAFGIRSLFS